MPSPNSLKTLKFLHSKTQRLSSTSPSLHQRLLIKSSALHQRLLIKSSTLPSDDHIFPLTCITFCGTSNMGTLGFLWSFTRASVTGALFGVTISDRYASIVPVRGLSMYPTFNPGRNSFPRSLSGDLVLVEKFCLAKYKFSHGDVIVFRSPSNHKETLVKRLIALPGEWIRVPESREILKIPQGHCWVEGDNSTHSLDSRSFGPIPLALIQGRVSHVIWPPQRMGEVERKLPTGRVSSY
ncbi:hypothetical protein MRB53_013139 [Persea americana]|uniref:Uncharacterized protein n=1 Tax=Persea americana TaxID=3435 RepID=A0ACC2K7F6_PERAE|nr:hypothetical protein MRB53_013139 [Persea americana]